MRPSTIDAAQSGAARRPQFRRLIGALISLVALFCPAVAHARWQGPPERPTLPASVDHNWSAYYDKGVKLLRVDERAPRTEQLNIRAAREALASLAAAGKP